MPPSKTKEKSPGGKRDMAVKSSLSVRRKRRPASSVKFLNSAACHSSVVDGGKKKNVAAREKILNYHPRVKR